MIGSYTIYCAVNHNFIGGKKWNFYCDVCLKSKKFQIAQIFKISITDHKVGSFSDKVIGYWDLGLINSIFHVHYLQAQITIFMQNI